MYIYRLTPLHLGGEGAGRCVSCTSFVSTPYAHHMTPVCPLLWLLTCFPATRSSPLSSPWRSPMCHQEGHDHCTNIGRSARHWHTQTDRHTCHACMQHTDHSTPLPFLPKAPPTHTDCAVSAVHLGVSGGPCPQVVEEKVLCHSGLHVRLLVPHSSVAGGYTSDAEWAKEIFTAAGVKSL